MSQDSIVIRPLHALDEMFAAVDLQRQYWGDSLESVVPAQMLYTIVSCGGHVIAAFDRDRMIGVVIGLIGTDIAVKDRPAMANLLIASKRMIVLPEYRSGGIGYRLKLAQRDAAVTQGIRLITWTFDPLRAPNAHLNLRKLGGIVREYDVNLYGTRDDTGLALFGWSDRLKLQWWVTHRRVEERLFGARGALTVDHYLGANATLVNLSGTADGVPVPPRQIALPRDNAFALVEIPLDFDALVRHEQEIARDWQQHVRTAMAGLFSAGYFISDFLRGTLEGRERGFYLFAADYGFDFSAN